MHKTMEMSPKPVVVLIVITILSSDYIHGKQVKRTDNNENSQADRQSPAVNQRVAQWYSKMKPTSSNSPSSATSSMSISPATIQEYVQKNCTSCLIREEAKFARIEKIKEDLLQKLGFKNAPNTSGELPLITPHLQNLFDRWGLRSDGVQAEGLGDGNYVDGEEPFTAQTERVYAFASEPRASVDIPESAYFRFSETTSNNKVENATLHFYLKQPKSETREYEIPLKITLYTIDDPLGTTMTTVYHKSDRKHLRFNGHWAQLDVTHVVAKWFERPETNFGVKLEAIYKRENLVYYPNKDSNGGKHTMYLEIITSLPRPKVKRDIPKLECEEKDQDTRCCRYPLIIDFETFGWDWVIAPKQYRANYCSGQCPFKHMQRHLHTYLVQQANPQGNAGPCCYPTQMSPILMVYFNENKEVLVSKVPGMIVTRCGCA